MPLDRLRRLPLLVLGTAAISLAVYACGVDAPATSSDAGAPPSPTATTSSTAPVPTPTSTTPLPTADASAPNLDGGSTTNDDAGDAATPDAPLYFTVQPSNGWSMVPLASFEVTVKNAQDQVDTAYGGPVALGIVTGPNGSALSGTTTTNAVQGVATFTDVAVTRAGTYTLQASAQGNVTTSSTFAIDAWRPVSAGTSGGTVRSFAVHPTNADIVYAGTDGGLYKTTNGTSATPTWTFVGLPGVFVSAIVIAKSAPATIYASGFLGGNTGVAYKSTDAGATWIAEQVAPAPGGATTIAAVATLAVDPTNASIVYRGGAGGFFKSVDGGVTWSSPSAPPFGTKNVRRIRVAPSSPQVVYAAVATAGVFRSSDGGDTWSDVTAGLPDPSVQASDYESMAVSPTDPDDVYLGISFVGVYHKPSGGSWTAISALATTSNVPSIEIDPNDANVIYVSRYGSPSAIFRSADGGKTWPSISAPLYPYVMAIAPSNASVVYLALYLTGVDGLVVSTNAGAKWSDAPTTSQGLRSFNVTGIAVDPTSSSTIYCAGASRIRKSINGGVDWALAGTGVTLGSDYALAISKTNPNVLYLGSQGNGVFVTTDGAASWSAAGTGTSGRRIAGVAVSPQDPAMVYATSSSSGPNVVFSSANGTAGSATTWAPGNIASVLGSGVAADPTNKLVAYAIAGGGLYKTTDATSWTKVSALTPCTPSCPVTNAVAVDSAGVLYAATRTGVYRSTDGGASITPPTTVIAATVLAIDPTDDTKLVAGTTGKGAFWSADSGKTWTSSGLDAWNVLALAYDTQNPQVIYAGVETGGLFKSVSGGR